MKKLNLGKLMSTKSKMVDWLKKLKTILMVKGGISKMKNIPIKIEKIKRRSLEKYRYTMELNE